VRAFADEPDGPDSPHKIVALMQATIVNVAG